MNKPGTRLCFQCKQRFPATSNFFVPDYTQSDLLSPSCRECIGKVLGKRISEALEEAGEPAKDPKNPNPKDVIGVTKIPTHLWPPSATILGSLGLLDGALKYGRMNYRGTEVRASIYYDACMRHLFAWFEGEEADPDSGLPHMAHALACLAIIVDAGNNGTLNDDRSIPGSYREFITKMTVHVSKLREKHKDKNPKHYTIKDKKQ